MLLQALSRDVCLFSLYTSNINSKANTKLSLGTGKKRVAQTEHEEGFLNLEELLREKSNSRKSLFLFNLIYNNYDINFRGST